MAEAFVCDAVRTPIGRYAGGLAPVRADDLGAVPLKALMERNPGVAWEAAEDVVFGCANQAGADNRNVARTVLLLAGPPHFTPGSTVYRSCGSGRDLQRTGRRWRTWSSAAPTRPARTTATWPAWPCCWRACPPPSRAAR